jgi:hypothetical protein
LGYSDGKSAADTDISNCDFSHNHPSGQHTTDYKNGYASGYSDEYGSNTNSNGKFASNENCQQPVFPTGNPFANSRSSSSSGSSSSSSNGITPSQPNSGKSSNNLPPAGTEICCVTPPQSNSGYTCTSIDPSGNCLQYNGSISPKDVPSSIIQSLPRNDPVAAMWAGYHQGVLDREHGTPKAPSDAAQNSNLTGTELLQYKSGYKLGVTIAALP